MRYRGQRRSVWPILLLIILLVLIVLAAYWFLFLAPPGIRP